MSEGGIFAGLGLADVSGDPFKIADGTYEFNIVDCTAGLTKKQDKFGITFKFEVITEGDEAGKTQFEWHEIPKADDKSAEAMQSRRYLRQRLDSLGIPESKMDTVKPEDFISITGYMTLATGPKNGQTYIKSISLTKPAEGVTAPSAPAATNSNLFD